ncbi:MAG: AMP-binding protein [Candidatus Binatia bacterium]
MPELNADTWQPQQHHLRDAHVSALAKALKLDDFERLREFSLRQPAEYWQAVIDFLKFSWSSAPTGYVDVSRGIEFPDWFPGGQLNWVDTVLAWGDHSDTANCAGVVAEREDGSYSAVSFGELAASVRRLAAGLQRQGVRRGDCIGLLCENGIEATVSVLALSYLGAIVVPLFSGFGVDAIVSRLESSGARGLIATTGFHRRARYVDTVPAVREALLRLPDIEWVCWKPANGIAVPDGGLAWADLAETPHDGARAARMSPDDPFMVIYTSGTTGKPKGAVHTHGGFPLKIAHDSAVHFDVGQGDVFCWPADMGWIAGTLVLSAALLRGATLVLYDGAPDWPDWSRMSRLIERHRVTHFGSAPTLIRGLAANAPASLAGDRATVELLITAGEVIDPEHFTWFRKHFAQPASPLINYTGGTEASGALLSSVVVKPIAPGAFNTASPGVDVAVVDATGQPLVGAVGELAIRAPFVGMTRSFWRDDQRYLETYWQTVPGMWIHGDLALQTPDDGFLVLGRSDDTIKVAGKRLGPAEVEEVLLEMPDIREAAAVGVADSVKGEKLVVFIVPTAADSDQSAFAAAVTGHIERRLGKPFKPRHVHFVTQLPKTRSSKVMRRVIRRLYSNQPLGDLSALENPAALEEIRSLIENA